MGRFLTLAASLVLIVACGGQSVVTGDGEAGAGQGALGGSGGDGKAGAGGRSPVGAAGSSGSSAGSTSAGGAGSGSAGSGSAGSSSAGSSSAGSSSAGSSTGGSGPASRCEQPIDSGSCLAYVPSYAFNPTSRYCQRFIYGGCNGNDNRFETLSDCEAACGGSDQGSCPQVLPPDGAECEVSGDKLCYFNEAQCQCAPTGSGCLPIDPFCPALPTAAPPPDDECTDPNCPSRIVIPVVYECRCTSSGWDCQRTERLPGG